MKLKPLIFRLLAVLLPLGLLLALEGGLRLAGAGAEPAFVPLAEQPGYQTFNPAYAQRYFRGFLPAVAYHPFRTAKTEATLRLVVLGGSTAAGFPYHFPYGFPDRLAARLEGALSDREIEVINLGMTAVNSYTLWDLKAQVAALQPDAVLIYAGHNEYYGALGVGSTETVGGRRWMKRLVLRLRRTALYTTLEGLLTPAPEPEAAGTRTMMAQVVRDAGIARGSAAYEAGLAQFEANMRDVLGTFQAAGIPIYLATLTANLADQPPLGDDSEAEAAYARGRQLLAAGDTLGARTAFTDAKDLDVIRFRAPEALNAIIQTLAEAPGVTLVDVQQTFHTHSPQHLEGTALFDDHLHPNARGYDLMAAAFFEALRSHPDLSDLAEAPAAPVALDPIEQAHATLQIDLLKSGFPFDKTKTPAEEAQAYEALLESRLRGGLYDSLAARVTMRQAAPPEALYAALRHARQQADTLAALRLYGALLPWQPFNEQLMQEAVGYAAGQPRYDEAVAALARTAAHRTGRLDYLNTVAAIRLRQGRLGEAAAWLATAEARDAASPITLYNRARLHLVQGDTLAARRYFERYQAAR